LALVLVNQSSSQLVSRDRDLRHTVFENTALRLYLTSLGDDIDHLRDQSRDVPKDRRGVSLNQLSQTTQIREIFEPALERNDIIDASAMNGEAHLVLNSGEGHTEPIRVRFDPIFFTDVFTPEGYERLSITPLPARSEPPGGGSRRGRRRNPPRGEQTRRREHALRKLLEAKKAAERWDAQ
jgi:hypothetical protein